MAMDVAYIEAVEKVLEEEEFQSQKYTQPPMKMLNAKALVLGGMVQRAGNREYTVEGSGGDQYVWTQDEGCSCPGGTKGKKHCYHAAAVDIYRRVMEYLGKGSSTMSEYEDDAPWSPGRFSIPITDSHDLGPSLGDDVTMDAPGSDEASSWAVGRKELYAFLHDNFVEGEDYGKIHVSTDCEHARQPWKCKDPYHFSKDTLFKSGSEKLLTGFLKLRATFQRDRDTWEMLGSPAGTLCYCCTLVNAVGEPQGEGRGARDVQDDKTKAGKLLVNNTIKKACISAMKDAVLRTGALSEIFTQDLDDMQRDEKEETPEKKPEMAVKTEPAPASTSDLLRRRVAELMKRLGKYPRTGEAWGPVIHEVSGLPYVSKNLNEIVQRLEDAVAGQNVEKDGKE